MISLTTRMLTCVMPATVSLLALSACGGDEAASAAAVVVVGTQPSTAGTSTAPSPPPPPPPVVVKNPDLGVNLEGISDYSRLKPFADLMRSSRAWGRPDQPWLHTVAVDAAGWPTEDAGVVVEVNDLDSGDSGPAYRQMQAGAYKLSFKGRATVTFVASTGSIKNYTYDAATDRSTADVVIDGSQTQMMLAFRETKGGVRDVSLMLPGYVPGGKVFTDEYVALLAPFSTVRVMDWLHTNNNPLRTWAERARMTDATQSQAKGAAAEYAIMLANEADKDLWVTVPVGADDNYIREFARLLQRDLEPGRNLYVEFSNEIWNYQFSQATVNQDAAVAEVVAGDTSLTNGVVCTAGQFKTDAPGCNKYEAGFHRVGKRTVQISKIFAEIFGQAAINKSVRVIYATQFGNPWIAQTTMAYVAKHHGDPKNFIYGIAGAPYYSLSTEVSAKAGLTREEIFAGFDDALTRTVLPRFASGVTQNNVFTRGAYAGDRAVPSLKALADYYGIKSLAYEAGSDYLQNANALPEKLASNNDVRTGEQLDRYLAQWWGCGNGLYMHFTLSSTWGQYGYWGLINDPGVTTRPKWQSIVKASNRTPASYANCT